MPKQNIYVIMVAINDYAVEAHNLKGCVPDKEEMKQYLESLFGEEGVAEADKQFHLQITDLENDQATVANVKAAFEELAGKVEADDIVMFHFGGHGSKTPAPEEFWHLHPDKNMESLVMYESRLPGNFDLTGKELGYLIWKVTHKKKPHFLAFIDACHSGAATRDINELAATPRMAEPANTQRPIDQFIGFDSYAVKEVEGKKQYTPPVGPHVLMSGCRDDETSKELRINRQKRGIFTWSVIRALEGAGGDLSYFDLLSRVRTQIGNWVDAQHPQLSASVDPESRFRKFLAGKAPQKPEFYTLANEISPLNPNLNRWFINAGQVQGIPVAGGANATKVQVFDVEADHTDASKAIATLEINKVEMARAYVAGAEDLNKEKVYKALITELAVAKMVIALDPESEQAGMEEVQKAFENLDSPLLEIVAHDNAEKPAKYFVYAENGELMLKRPGVKMPVFRRLKGYTEENAELFASNTEKVAKAEQAAVLSNPNAKLQINQDFEVLLTEVTALNDDYSVASEKEADIQNAKFAYAKNADGDWEGPKIRVAVKNTRARSLWVSVLFLGSDYSVSMPIANQRIDKGNDPVQLYMVDEEGDRYDVIWLGVDDAYLSWGIHEVHDIIKVVVSTEELDLSFMAQEGVPLEVNEAAGTRGIKMGRPKPKWPKPADWASFDIGITTHRAQ